MPFYWWMLKPWKWMTLSKTSLCSEEAKDRTLVIINLRGTAEEEGAAQESGKN